MRHRYILFLLAAVLHAQPASVYVVPTAPTGACVPRDGIRIVSSTGGIYSCHGNTWGAQTPADNTPVTPGGSTPPPAPPPSGGPPVVTSFPTNPEPNQQVVLGGVLYQFVGAAQYAGIPGFWEPVVSIPPTLQDTHANRLANYPPYYYVAGTLFFETDRMVIYKTNGSAWSYWSGAMAGALADLPTDLGANDANFHYQATDYKHLYVWIGSAWSFGPNDAGSGFLVVNPTNFQLSIGLWGLCSGATYSVAQNDGTTMNVTPATAPNTYIRR